MKRIRPQRSGLYRLEAFGFSEWNVWRLRRDALDEPELETRRRRRALYADDFLDPEALAIARGIFPDLELTPGRRLIREPRIFG